MTHLTLQPYHVEGGVRLRQLTVDPSVPLDQAAPVVTGHGERTYPNAMMAVATAQACLVGHLYAHRSDRQPCAH